MRGTQNFAAERLTALAAILAGTLVALLAVHADAGIGNIIGATMLAYMGTIVAVAIRVPLRLLKVVTASGKGTILVVVITAIVLISIAKAFRGLA